MIFVAVLALRCQDVISDMKITFSHLRGVFVQIESLANHSVRRLTFTPGVFRDGGNLCMVDLLLKQSGAQINPQCVSFSTVCFKEIIE